MMRKRLGILLGVVVAGGRATWPAVSAGMPPDLGSVVALARSDQPPSGASRTQLPNGRLIELGGEDATGGVTDSIVLEDPTTGVAVMVGHLAMARAWHSATVLPDGTVVVMGGLGADGQVIGAVEVFDPGANTSRILDGNTSIPRALQTATLLTDGHVLVAGGIGPSGEPLATLVLWDSTTLAVETLSANLSAPRFGQTATLLPDGRVYFHGGDEGRAAIAAAGDIYDPATGQIEAVDISPSPDTGPPRIVAADPANGATGVALDVASLVLRASTPLRVESATAETVALSGPDGPLQSRVVAAEDGMLIFVTPSTTLRADSRYALTINRVLTQDGTVLAPRSIRFITRDDASSPTPTAHELHPSSPGPVAPAHIPDDEWIPNARNFNTGEWTTGRPDSRWRALPPLRASTGVTALAGQILKLNGEPLRGAKLELTGTSTHSDETGRFLLVGASPGDQALWVDGGPTHGTFEVHVTLTPGQTTAVPFTIWLPRIEIDDSVNIPSPSDRELVITTPKIPGLELHIPPDTTIRDHAGQVVTRITITPVPLDRPPFPTPSNARVPVYFTIQPGGAYIDNQTGAKARLVYPNGFHFPAGMPFAFWHYDPDQRGWYVYGTGRVSADEQHAVPDSGFGIYEFTGAMADSGRTPPDGTTGTTAGEPVDLALGIFVASQTDLVLPDIIPINLTRTYHSTDPYPRPFGIGMTHPYELFLWSPNKSDPYSQINVPLPDGSVVHYVGPTGQVFYQAHLTYSGPLPSRWAGSTLNWNGTVGWDLTLKNGMVYVFAANGPLQSIRDRFGNTLTITRPNGDLNGPIQRITSPSGRWAAFTYSPNCTTCISQVTDILGRIRNYVYDTSGRLTDVKDANQNILTHYNYYTSGACQLMKDITDARQITYLTNQYIVGATRTSANPCLVSLQTLADQTTFSFSYFNNYRLYYDITTAGGTCVNHVCPMFDPSILDPPSVTITQAGVSNPQGVQRKVTFDPDTGYAVKDSRALGLPEEQTTTYNDGVASSGVLNYFTDQLNRRTTISYDTAGKGDIVSITRLTGTSSQKTWTFSYEPKYHQLQTMAEPGLPASTLGYDTSGNLKSVTDPSGVKWTLQLNTHGQVASVTDPLGLYTTSFRYEAGDLVGIKDPNGNETVRFVDAGGRLRAVRDALSRITRYDYDEINRRTTITDPLGNATQFGYDGNGNLTSVQDARLNTTVYDYDSMDRLMDRKDPLYPSDNSHIDRYTYDFAGNLASHTDRKGQVTVLSYDNLNRAKCVKFAATVGANACAAPDIQYTVDAGNRLTGIADSNPTAGNIALTPDNLDFYTTVSSPQGIISYTPDPATGRRSQMSVSGQSTTTYGFDSADRLSQVTRGANAVSIIPESPIPTGRIGTVNLPGGYSVVYGYDPNGRVSSVQYKNGTSVLGGLTYTYDAVGNRTGVGGSWSGTLVPSSVSFGSYDAANRLSSLTYDKNNNVTYDGTNTYGWDVRDQLAGVTGPTNETFQYDSFGRRLQRTVAGVPNNYTYDGLNPINVTANGTSTDLLGGLRLDQYFATVASSVTKAILPDALGSTIALADTSSPPTQPQFTYEPFGRSSNPAGPPVIQFTGRENDGDGLYYYRARYYQPTSGRFISEDPIGITARAPNLYAYVGNSPIGHRDPTGLCPMIAPMSGGLFNFLPDILPEGAGEGWTIGEPTDPTWQGNSFFSPDGFEFHWTQYARSHASDFPNGYWHVMDWNTGDLTRVGPNDTGGFGGSNNGGLVPPFGGRKAGSAPSRPPGWPCT